VALTSSPNSGGLAGLVRHAETGASIPGAVIRVFDPGGTLVHQTAVGSDGRFSQDEIPPASYALTVSAEGFIPALMGVLIEAGCTAGVTVLLQPSSGSVAGTAVDAVTAAPLSGAAVAVANAFPVAAAVADDGGRFSIPDLAPGQYTITASVAGHGQACQGLTVTSGHQSRVTLALSPNCGILAGTVRDISIAQPLAGASIQVLTTGGRRIAEVRSDRGGHYRTPPLHPGRYLVMGGARGFGHDTVGVEAIRDHPAQADLGLMPCAGAMTGAITDAATGAPMPGAVVRAYDSLGAPVAQAVSDGNGRYCLPGLAEDYYMVTVSAQGRQTALSGAYAAANNTIQVNMALAPGPGQIEVNVADAATGRHLPGAAVRVYSQDDVLLDTLLMDGDGRFTANGLVPGYYKLIAAKEGYATGWTGAAVVAGITTGSLLALTRGAGVVSGVVCSVDAGPVVAMVTVYTSAGLAVDSQVTDIGGCFTITGLRAGDYFLQARSPALAAAVAEFTIAPDETTRLRVVMDGAAAALRARLSAEGQPVRGAAVRVFDERGRQTGLGLTNPEGVCVLPDLPPGTGSAIISGPGLATAVIPLALRAGHRQTLAAEVQRGPCRVLKPIQDAFGQPATNAQVRILNSSGRFLFTALTNDEGFFWLRAWEPSEPEWNWEVRG